jgi:peptidylprolyl isomerase
VGSGRVQIDFNHRLAGRTLTYKVDIIKKLENEEEKVHSLIKRRLPIDDDRLKFTINGENLTIEIPVEAYLTEGLQVIKRGIATDIFKFVPKIARINFTEVYESTKSSEQLSNIAESTPQK